LTTLLPSFCRAFFSGEKCSIVAVADPFLRVLVVAVGVHHDVRAVPERVVDAVAERPGQPHVAGVVDEVPHTEAARQLDRAVRGPVVDDQDLYLVDARNAPWNRGKHLRKGFFLVQAGNLHEQLHGPVLSVAGSR
jgi:hypothetical protein